MEDRLSLKTIMLFFLPLIFMTEMIQISHSVTNAFLARLSAPLEVLAAFSIAFAFNILTGGVNMAGVQVGISFIADRNTFFKVFRFLGAAALAPFVLIEVVSLTPVGDLLFGNWMGASPEVVRQAKTSSAIMGLWTFPILIRNQFYALAMIRRRTILITYATFVRLAALAGSLLFYSAWFEGAVVGAMATVSGMTVEAAYMALCARSCFLQLPERTGPAPPYSQLWKFSWPLMLTQMTENGVVFVTNLFLGRLTNPDLAIAAFGVVYGLARVILAPLRNLVNTAQALTKSRKDLKILFQFTLGLLLFYSALILVMFFTPLRSLILENLMGLTQELHRYCTPAVKLTLVVAVFWATAALLRGILSAMRKTGAIAATAFIRLFVISGIGSLSYFQADLNGAVLGVAAIAGAFGAETVVLGIRFRHHIRIADQAAF